VVAVDGGRWRARTSTFSNLWKFAPCTDTSSWGPSSAGDDEFDQLGKGNVVQDPTILRSHVGEGRMGGGTVGGIA